MNEGQPQQAGAQSQQIQVAVLVEKWQRKANDLLAAVTLLEVQLEATYTRIQELEAQIKAQESLAKPQAETPEEIELDVDSPG